MEFMEMIRGFKNIEISKAPNFLTVKSMYAKLIKLGLSEAEAVHVVANMEIDVNESFASHYLEETTDIYAAMVLKLRSECNQVSPLLFSKYIESNKLTLKFSM